MRFERIRQAGQEGPKPRTPGRVRTASSPDIPSPAAGLRRGLGNHAVAVDGEVIAVRLDGVADVDVAGAVRDVDPGVVGQWVLEIVEVEENRINTVRVGMRDTHFDEPD